ncbi:DNA-binding CsgD family transcriptional regulator [Chryseobacterium sp. H1D6B]|uniref:hypothetical protein n=1 Tax=Chryseobacterium sp. H1D6B TaxID=2940588 RepID=UPI0015C9F22E|nr:hypothetical protein [Chryseobacterium sp. H1D6B]MDH6252961.1 DNA-binding CsgD family transcriptional regulator [Chryseobacterium sp. H1D6B]
MEKKLIAKMKNVMYSLLMFLSAASCHSSKEAENKYLYDINGEVSTVIYKPTKIKALHDREAEKYKKTGDKKYLISSRYIDLFYYYNSTDNKDGLKQLPLVYELLKLNNNEYDYISIACNFNLAFQFENNSPKLAFHFLDEAIVQDEKSGKKYFLPHLYHLKGRLFYNQKDYNRALFYFNKSLQNLDKKDILHIASMYNNFGSCYEKMGKMDPAIRETDKGIKILEKKTQLNNDETAFLNSMRGNLGFYYFKIKDYPAAETLLLQEFNFYRDKKQYYEESIASSQRLFDLYNTTGQAAEARELINFLTALEPKLENLTDRIPLNEMLQTYYSNINDIQNLKIISKKLVLLHKECDEFSNHNLAKVSDIVNNYVIKSINHKYDYKIISQKRNNLILSALIFLSIIIFSLIIINTRNKRKKEKELLVKEKLIFENNKKILEQFIQRQKDKIENLHLNLNLKIQTEKAFLEYLKKIKRSKNIDIEEILKDLFFKINNLIQIDKKNYDLINESSSENKLFVEKLSSKFPVLTNQELKLCVYFKLNLSSKEISLLEGITEGSARVYKTKVKAKMNLDKETDLNLFLKNI